MRYVCIHGHFYQPPRENPWLEEIEVQDSARPFHDWNDRITAECYQPNAWARILDGDGFITEIRNNYSRINWDFGPTLLNWLAAKAPEVYEALRAADRESRERFSGHGSGIAQAYNHMILPLAHPRDKETQVLWGIEDFRDRFGRAPEGMWLPETAVDVESLELLAAHDIRYTIFAPTQAKRVRPKGKKEWTDVSGGTVDPRRAYEIPLPSGRTIAGFFYDGPISHDIAFGGVLHSGDEFANRLLSVFSPEANGRAELSHVATDGETYGHHHRHTEMALAVALARIEQNPGVRLTNYGQFLAEHPPEYEAEVKDQTAWSCSHGVGRWWTNCGCNAGRGSGWQQTWRTGLREALDWLRDRLMTPYEETARRLLRDPWGARNRYVRVLLDRSSENVDRFLAEEAAHPLSEEEVSTALELLELERQVEQMYTSCGWFFDDLGGIETVQVIEYASRAIQLAQFLFGIDLEPEFKERLARAQSNIPENGNGASIYEKFVKPTRIDLQRVCAHYALSSLFEPYGEVARIYAYTVRRIDRHDRTAGTARLAVGRAEVRSEVTRRHGQFTYGALYIGGHVLFGGVRPFRGDAAYADTARVLTEAFDRGDIPEAVRQVDAGFGSGTYSLSLLFRDEQRKIVDLLLEATREEVEAGFRRIYNTTAPILRYLADAGTPPPRSWVNAVEFYLNQEIIRELDRPEPAITELASRLAEIRRMNLGFDTEALGFALTRTSVRLMQEFQEHPDDPRPLGPLSEVSRLTEGTSVPINLAPIQNAYYRLAREELPKRRERAGAGDAASQAWVKAFTALGERLKMRLR